MQINSINNNISPQFKAIKVAKTSNTINNLTTNIDIYKLNPKKDNLFLKNLKDKINFRKLFPQMPEFEARRIQRIFNYTINSAADSNFTAYVAISENKVCGILSFLLNDNNNTFIDGICSIPTDINKKVRKVGTTLLLQVFNDASQNDSKELILDAVNDSPVNIIEKYKNLGFKPGKVSIEYTNMRCNKNNREEQLKLLKKDIEYNPVFSDENIDLNQFID